MQTQPIISVIIVNYNGGAGLTQCVANALATDRPVEVWVVDNASQDGSLAALAAMRPPEGSALQVLRNDANRGFAAAANQALPLAHGHYLLFLNPDCYIARDTLPRLSALLDAHPRAGMAGGLVRNEDGTIQNACRRAVPTPWRSLVRVLHLHRVFPGLKRFDQIDGAPDGVEVVDGISGACMFVRRSALEQVGPMDESYFLHCEDLDWFMRFRAAGWQILFDPSIEVRHIKGVCSRAQPVRVLWYKHRGMLLFYNKFFRHRYPLPLAWGVTAAVWLRFALLATDSWLRAKFGHWG